MLWNLEKHSLQLLVSFSPCSCFSYNWNKMDSSLSKTIRHSIANTSDASTTKAPLPHHSKASSKSKTWSVAMDHFKEDFNEDYKVTCNYCSTLFKFKGGPIAMKNHLLRCLDNPNKGQKVQRSNASSLQIIEGQVGGGVRSSPSCFKFDQELYRKELVKMFVIVKMPFRSVENEAFIKFIFVLQPQFSVPITCYINTWHFYTLWLLERKVEEISSQELWEGLSYHNPKWSSIQNFTYMSLTTHFIDNNWKLQKKILSFRQITRHSGENMA